MSIEGKALSLPNVVGEETVIELQKAIESKRGSASGLAGFFARKELKKGQMLYSVGEVPSAIYMLRGGTIRLRTVASRPMDEMPVTTVYHAAPDNGNNRPLLGARYFFNRRPCTLEYGAETACSLYEITSGGLSDLHDADRQAILLVMYWLISASDLSDIFVPVANKALGLEETPANETQGLLRAVEEFRAARDNPRMPGMLYRMYKKFMARRIERAKELGIEASIVQHVPAAER